MSVQAGRPMSVDDANVNAKGVAHSQTLQAKMQVTAAQDQGCYFAWPSRANQSFSGLCQQSLRQSLSHFDAIYTRRQNAAGITRTFAGRVKALRV